jgi:hypothetical protein
MELAAFAQVWKAGLSSRPTVEAFGWKTEDVEPAYSRVNAFLTAWDAFLADDSTGKRLIKNETKKAMKEVMQEFANTSIRYNKLMTDEDKLRYGIHPADRKPTPNPPPATFPEAEADSSIIRQITIHFWDSATKKRAKPHGVHGAEIRWALLDAPPASEEELVHSEFDTASPVTIKFDESMRGKRLYFCLRWESTTNLKGPSSEIYSAVIP